MLTQISATILLCLASSLIPLFECLLIFFPICVLAFVSFQYSLFLLPVLSFSFAISFPSVSIRRILVFFLLLGVLYLQSFIYSLQVVVVNSNQVSP
jgi:hypothetical protein